MIGDPQPPFFFVQNDKITGYAVELTHLLAEKMGVEVMFDTAPPPLGKEPGQGPGGGGAVESGDGAVATGQRSPPVIRRPTRQALGARRSHTPDSLSQPAPRIIAAAFSPIMMVGALVLPVVILGITEASATRRPSTP